MIDHDNLEEFRDAEIYDLQDEGYEEDYSLTAQWARALGGPLLDLACGTGRMALRLAAQSYQVTGVDITTEMIARARQKAAQQSVSIEWVVADARNFHLQKQFPFIYMLENVFQFFLTRADQEAMLACTWEHLLPVTVAGSRSLSQPLLVPCSMSARNVSNLVAYVTVSWFD